MWRSAARVWLTLVATLAVVLLSAQAQCINTVFASTGSSSSSSAPTFFVTSGVTKLHGRIYFSDLYTVYVIHRDSTYSPVAGGGDTLAVPAAGLPAWQLKLLYVYGLAGDARRNRVYISDHSGRVLYVDVHRGLVFVLAGAADGVTTGNSGDGGLATRALLGSPSIVALLEEWDALLIPDFMYGTVRAVNLTSGVIRLVAGNSSITGDGPSLDGVPATTANLYTPKNMALDPVTGVLYIAEAFAPVIRAVAPDGTISTVFGTRGNYTYGGDGGPAAAATGYSPTGLAIDAADRRLFFTDREAHVVRCINLTSGIVTRVAGSPDTYGRLGDGGPSEAALLNFPRDLYWDAPSATLLVIDGDNGAIRRITNGTIDTVSVSAEAGAAAAAGAGAGTAAASSSSRAPVMLPAPLRPAALDTAPRDPADVAVDCFDGALYVSDWELYSVRRVSREGEHSFFAGIAGAEGAAPPPDGSLAADVQIGHATAIAIDSPRRVVFLYSRSFCCIYAVNVTSGVLWTVAGNGTCSESGEGGPARAATFNEGPARMAVDPAGGRLFVSFRWSHVIRMITYGGGSEPAITTIAGTLGVSGYSPDGPASGALLNGPYTMAWDPVDQMLIFIDSYNALIRSISAPVGGPVGNLSTLAGNYSDGSSSRSYPDIPPEGMSALSMSAAGDLGLSLDAPRRQLYFSHNWYFARLNLTSGLVTVAAGARTFETGGGPLGGSPFNYSTNDPSFVAADCNGGFFLKSTYVVLHVVPDKPDATPCPAGYSCPCGRHPVPCSSPGSFCPADTGKAIVPVSKGFRAVPVSVEGVIGLSGGYAAQEACPTGTYCLQGVLTPCPVGTYGVDDMQVSSSGCLQCPPGTYQPRPGVGSPSLGDASFFPCRACPPGSYAALTASQACSLCRPNTFGSRSGGSSASLACTACPVGTWAPPGTAASCVKLQEVDQMSSTAAAGGAIAFQRQVQFDPRNEPFLLSALSIGLPLLVVFSLPLLSVVFTRFGPPAVKAKASTLLTRVDNTGLAHPVPVGASPVKKPTSLGGGFTMFFIGVFLAVASVQISQFRSSNTVVQEGLLPLSFGDLSVVKSLPPYAATYADLSDILPGVSVGFSIVLATAGPDCAAVDDFAIDLLAGSMTVTSVPDPASDAVRHVFHCRNCVPSAQSTFAAWFNESCTTFSIAAASVGAWGRLSYASVVVTDVAAVETWFPISLEMVQDSIEGQQGLGGSPFTGGRSARGLAVRAGSVEPRFTVEAADLGSTDVAPTILISFPLDTTYKQVLLTPATTGLQLVNSLVGLLSLLGLSKVVIGLVAKTWEAKQQQQQQLQQQRQMTAAQHHQHLQPPQQRQQRLTAVLQPPPRGTTARVGGPPFQEAARGAAAAAKAVGEGSPARLKFTPNPLQRASALTAAAFTKRGGSDLRQRQAPGVVTSSQNDVGGLQLFSAATGGGGAFDSGIGSGPFELG